MKTQVENLTPSPSKNKLNVTTSNVERPVDTSQYSPHYAAQQAKIEKVPSTYYSMRDELASQFIFYDPLSDLNIKPFSVEDVLLVNYSYTSGSLRPLAQAINNVIYEDVDCFDLSYSDVKQLMCWLRVNSFFKTKMKIKVVCTNDEHQNAIVNGDLLVDTLINEFTLLHTDFIINKINPELANNSFLHLRETYGLEFYPLTFGMYIEFEELLNELTPKDEDDKVLEKHLDSEGKIDINTLSPENQTTLFIASYAKYLSVIHGNTLKDKIEFFKVLKLSPDIFQDIREFVESTHHNISEQVVNTCKECGGEIISEIVITPSSFFP